MNIIKFDDPIHFQSKIEDYLLIHEAENNLPLGILSSVIAGEFIEVPPYLAMVEDQGQPQLVSPEMTFLHLGHLLVLDALPGGHPLALACGEHSTSALRVVVTEGTLDHVGDGLDATVGMPWEARDVIVGVVAAELVQQHEGVDVAQLVRADDPIQPNACSIGHGHPFDYPRNAGNFGFHQNSSGPFRGPVLIQFRVDDIGFAVGVCLDVREIDRQCL